MDDQLFVRSHTARDLLQSAALFKTDRLVVWEYVSNALEYVDPGTNPLVRVFLDSGKKSIRIVDNGRGMSWEDLQSQFLVMHGENVDRKEGRPGRGRFGTGKSAAFGIADVLRVTTVKNGARTCIELSRKDIDAMAADDPVPVRTIEHGVATNDPNGTRVEIEKIHLKSLDQDGIIHYIERHLAKWSRNVTVFVNNHECEFSEPPVSETYHFRPDGAFENMLGEVELVVKVSKAPLDEDLRGVSIFANGVWYETTLAGSEGREMAQYLFGEIDVPKLDEDNSAIPAVDMSRSMRLNPMNELVQAIHAFIGQSIEQVRKSLAESDRRRKADQEARRLEDQAREIARVINDDFTAFKQRVMQARAKAGGMSDLGPGIGQSGDSEDDLLPGLGVPAAVVSPTGGLGAEGDDGGDGGPPRTLKPDVRPTDETPDTKGRPAGGQGSRRRPSGGFDVRFSDMGVDSYRAQYVRDERTIYINLEHAQIAAAKGLGSIDDAAFRRLAYEVAFSEYAVALASELAARDEYLDPTDPIIDIRETLNRVAKKAATLYL